MQRWTVKDVMTHNVVSVTEETTYKEIVEALAHNGVSAVPVVDDGTRVLGIVSEADLLHKMEFTGPEPHVHLLERKQRRVARAKASGDAARDLMSGPAITCRAPRTQSGRPRCTPGPADRRRAAPARSARQSFDLHPSSRRRCVNREVARARV
jgi:CBS-domain-containing membrane protein